MKQVEEKLAVYLRRIDLEKEAEKAFKRAQESWDAAGRERTTALANLGTAVRQYNRERLAIIQEGQVYVVTVKNHRNAADKEDRWETNVEALPTIRPEERNG